VWQIDKLERVVALDVRSDDLETLVLDENLPGSRSPMRRRWRWPHNGSGT